MSCHINLVPCKWNEWEVGECSEECGGGTRINTRTKRVEEMFGGTCDGESRVEEDCNTENCPGIHSILYKLL